jgi:hypothetical protein
VTQVYHRWEHAVDDDEQAWAAKEVKTRVKEIEWDLQDLEEAIQKIQTNSQRFSISQQELANRTNFVSTTRGLIKKMEKDVSDGPARGNATRHTRNVLFVYFPIGGFLYVNLHSFALDAWVR